MGGSWILQEWGGKSNYCFRLWNFSSAFSVSLCSWKWEYLDVRFIWPSNTDRSTVLCRRGLQGGFRVAHRVSLQAEPHSCLWDALADAAEQWSRASMENIILSCIQGIPQGCTFSTAQVGPEFHTRHGEMVTWCLAPLFKHLCEDVWTDSW